MDKLITEINTQTKRVLIVNCHVVVKFKLLIVLVFVSISCGADIDGRGLIYPMDDESGQQQQDDESGQQQHGDQATGETCAEAANREAAPTRILSYWHPTSGTIATCDVGEPMGGRGSISWYVSIRDPSSCEDICNVMCRAFYNESESTGLASTEYMPLASICTAKPITVQEAQDLYLEDDRARAAAYQRRVLSHKALQELNDTSRWDEGCEVKIARCSDPRVVTHTVITEFDPYERNIESAIHRACEYYIERGEDLEGGECDLFMRLCIDKYEPDRDSSSSTFETTVYKTCPAEWDEWYDYFNKEE